MARRTLKDFSDLECIEAYRENMKGEGCAMISGYGDRCSYRTADAMINRGRRIVEAMKALQNKLKCEAALDDFNYVGSRHHY